MKLTKDTKRAVRNWLGVMLGLILLMVAVGGITRLTESGLSMVTWEPILGAWPPVTDADWQFRFDQYRSSPEYQQIRQGMSLDEFKFIFFWEYLHRLLGRLLGVVYGIPLLVFWWRGRLDGLLTFKLLLGLVLGGAQGFMGWYMVKSGLAENPYVSHYRLAAHLGLAFILLAYLVQVYMSIKPWRRPELPAPPKARTWGVVLGGLLVAQIAWGAFVAGLNAGFIYNTWPLMQGQVIAPAWNAMHPLWVNVMDNPVTVQFVHRWLGALLLAATLVAWSDLRRHPAMTGLRASALTYFTAGLGVQVGLGILTLIWSVPLMLGVMHQVMAGLLVGLNVLWLVSCASERRAS